MNTPRVSNRADFFVTKKLQLAAYIHATKQLEYRRAEPTFEGRKVRFIFDDPDHRGSSIELSFERDRATCCARDLFVSQTFLRREASEATETDEFRRINGEKRNEHQPRRT